MCIWGKFVKHIACLGHGIYDLQLGILKVITFKDLIERSSSLVMLWGFVFIGDVCWFHMVFYSLLMWV